MNILNDPRARLLPWLIIFLAPLILLAPALRPGYTLLPAALPYQIDPLWQSLAPPDLMHANPVLSDQFYQYHAWQTTLRRALAQGEVAWWTPAVNGGQPLANNGQVGRLDPFNLIGLLFPLSTAYVVGALLRLWVAATFTYLYARTITLSRPAALLAALTFSLSGLLIHWLGATPSHVLVWFPALLWTGEQLLITRHRAWVAIAAILVAILFLSSQPEIALQVGLAWGCYLLLRAAWLSGGLWRGLRQHGTTWLLIALLGAAMAAIELLPFIDALRHSIVFTHRSDASAPGITAWLRDALFTWQAWPTAITALLPHFLGIERDDSNWYPLGNSFENNAYAGVIPLLLALFSLWAIWRNPPAIYLRRWIWLWAALAFGALGLALQLPLFKILNDLPPLNLVAEGRWRGIYVFAIAILAAFGLDLLLTQPHLRRNLAWLLLGAATLNLLLVIGAYVGFTLFTDQLIASGRAFMEANVGSPTLDRPLDELYALVDARHAAKLAMLRPTNMVMYLPLLVAGVTGLLLWHVKRKPQRIIWLAPALLLLTSIDLLWTGRGVNAASPIAWLTPTPPAITYLQQQPGPFRVAGTQLILNPNIAMLTELETELVTQIEDVRGYDPLAVNRYQTLFAGIEGYVAAGYHTYLRHVDDPRLDRFNVSYALSRTPPTDPRWQPVFTDPSGVTIYHNATALPRAYMVYAAEIVATADAARIRTLDPAFPMRDQVVLETSPTGWTPPPTPPPTPPAVTLHARGPNSVELAVTTAVPGILVLLETYIPGWRATINAAPTPIYRANYAFRGVVVPTGEHIVTFTYAPPSLPLATATSITAWLIVLTLLIRSGLRHLRRKPTP